jgi:hypothetical protein
MDVTVENRDLFAYTAVCWRLARLAGPAAPALAGFLNAREADARVVLTASGAGCVDYRGGALLYDVAAFDAAHTDGPRADLYRSVRLRGADADEFVAECLVLYRAELYRRPPGGAVPRFAWNDDAGAWQRRAAAPRRPLGSLFLDCKARVFEDVKHFLDPPTMRLYADKHVVPVRVELLEGLPGAGKSSLVTAIASELGRGVAVLNAAHDVAAAVRQTPPGCLVVIEDVDCAFRGSDKRPFADLLTALDTTPEPTVVFLTTNDPAALDPALRRRVDDVVSFKPATRAQCLAMYEFFFRTADGFDRAWAHVSGRHFATSTFQKFLVRVAADTRSAGLGEAVEAALPAFDALAGVVDGPARAEMYS